MVIRRGRRREHPMTLPKGSRDLRSLRVLRNFRLRMRTPKGTPKESSDLRSHPLAILLLLRKKTQGVKRGNAENILPVGIASGQSLFRSRDFVTSDQKGPTRADIAQLPVAQAQNILPDRARGWRHFRPCDRRRFRSRHFRSCAMVRTSSRSSANTT
jgi:hypothetical protein